VRIGDAVVVEGEWSRVEEIGSTYIAVVTWDRRAWAVQVTSLREGSMELRVLMSAADAGRMFDMRCHVPAPPGRRGCG
jgi:hypothetical protein